MSLTKVKASNITLSTPAANSNDTTPATTAYVTTALANMVDSAPSTLNTLNELAAALGDDANFSTTVTNSIATKLPLAGGTLTGDIVLSKSGTNDAGIKFATQNANRYIASDENGVISIGTGTTLFGGTRYVTIDSGKVGIGATSISSWTKLQVEGTAGAQTGATQALYVTSPTATANEGVGIRMSAASGSHEAVGIIGMVNNASGNAGSMTFHTYNLGATIPEVMRITNTGNVGIGEQNPTSPLHISSATNRTLLLDYTAGSGSFSWASFKQSGTEKFRIFGDYNSGYLSFHNSTQNAHQLTLLDSGNVGIGTTGATTKLHVEGPQNDVYGQLYIRGGSAAQQDPQIAMGSSTNGRGFYLDDGDVNRFKIYTGHGKGASSGAYEFVLDNSGTIESKRTYANTTGSYSANVYVHSDGSFNRATSSRRYKTDIVDATKGLDEILQLKPRNYKPKNDRTDSTELNAEINDPHLDAEERTFAGLIAEEVHDLGLTEYVDYEKDGTTPTGLYYGNMVALLVKGIQEQQTIIDDLKSRIETLEG